MRATSLAMIGLLPLMAACQSETPAAPAATVKTQGVANGPTQPAAPAAKATATASSGGASAFADATEAYEFKYSYPVEAGVIPALAASLDKARGLQLADIKKVTAAEQVEAKKGGFDFRAHMLDINWKRVADLPGWLSLSADIATYTGGAHGNLGFDSLVWDKAAGKRLAPLSMFKSLSAFADAVRTPFCAALDKERALRRGAPVDRASGSEFDACIDPAEQTLLLGSSNGKAFDRMTIMVGPYAAGPYAEGSYEINLPVTKAVLAAVKPAYQPTFVVAK